MTDILCDIFELFNIKVSRLDVEKVEASAKLGVDEVKTGTKSDTE